MIEHYNAFISYRHTPHDSKIAETIQKQLERFKIPGAIQKTHGIKKIDRIFRDKEELPITSNLNETIEKALNNSDYLIVICSHAMLESIWVQREIDFFLKTHTKKQILTVIAEGEPVDVLPDILKTDEIEITNEDGSTEKVSIPAEPLSCDYRLPLKKAKKEELPRLAAALIGCSYDNLRQRQRQYRMRRLAIAGTATAAAMIGLTSYFAWSAAQIQENYIASLKNQSAYLASESNRLYENGDRLSAMILALEALPSSAQDDREVIPEAVDALVQSSHAYCSPGGNFRLLETSYSHNGEVNHIAFDETNQYMYVLHGGTSFSIWDTATHTEIFTKSYKYSADGIITTSDGHVILYSWQLIECFDGQTGESIWTFNNSVQGTVYDSAANCIVTTIYNLDGYSDAVVALIDVPTGKVLQTLSAEPVFDETECLLTPLASNTEQNIIALKLYKSYGDNVELALWNTSDDSLTYVPLATDYIEHAIFSEDNKLLLTYPVKMPNTMDGYSYISIIKGQEYHILGDTKMQIQCYEANGQILWETEHPYSLLYSGTTVDFVSPVIDNVKVPAVSYSVGNTHRLYNLENGTVLNEVVTSDTILTTAADDTSISFFLKNGMTGGANYGGVYGEIASTIENIGIAVYSDRLYVCQSGSNQVLSYRRGLYDENWSPLGTFPASDRVIHLGETGTIIISDTSEGFGFSTPKTSTVSFITDKGILWQKDVDRNYYNYSYLGQEGDTLILLYNGIDQEYNSIDFIDYWDLKTGSFESVDVGGYGFSESTLIYLDGQYIWGTTRGNGDGTFDTLAIVLNQNLNSISEYAVIDPEIASSFHLEICDYSEDGSILLTKSGKHYVLLTETQVTPIAAVEDAYNAIAAFDSNTHYVAISELNSITVYDETGKTLYQVDHHGRTPLSIQFYEGALLIVYDNGTLRRYSAADGTYLTETQIGIGSLAGLSTPIWDSYGDELWLLIDEELSIIDTTTWKQQTAVSNCIDFNILNSNILVCGWEDGMSESDEKVIGTFHRYSVEELITRAVELLGSIELTEEQKAQYGLS